jgi:hypothetical protein
MHAFASKSVPFNLNVEPQPLPQNEAFLSDTLISIAAILGGSVGVFLSPLLNGSHRLKSRSYQIRNLKNLLTGSPADLYLLHLLKALANR